MTVSNGLASPDNAAAASTGPLDPQALANLAVLDPGGANRLVQRVLSTYQGSLARLLGQLDTAESGGDQATVRLVAHTLKSSSASIGALALSSVCAAAEQAVRDGRIAELPPMLARLREEAARVEAAVQQLLSA